MAFFSQFDIFGENGTHYLVTRRTGDNDNDSYSDIDDIIKALTKIKEELGLISNEHN